MSSEIEMISILFRGEDLRVYVYDCWDRELMTIVRPAFSVLVLAQHAPPFQFSFESHIA